MAVADVVSVLVEYCEDGEETFRDLRGPEAVIAVQDVIDLLQGELGGQLDYGTLWDEFEAAPRQTAPDLIGALEAMIEADPGLADKLEVLLEEYYATSRPVGPTAGDRMPESEASQVVPREDARIERHEVEPRRHTDVAGEGTYLYGNVRAGDVAVEKSLELGSDVLDGMASIPVRRELDVLSFDVAQLFDQLRTTVGQEAALSDEIRAELRQELDGLEAEMMLGDEADQDRLVEHLRRVGDLDPDFLGLLLAGLRHTRSEAQAVVENAIQRASEEEGS
jgi:hypothetical protein